MAYLYLFFVWQLAFAPNESRRHK